MTTKSTTAWTLALLCAACGGAQKTSSREMTELGRKAPPPPSNVTPGQKIARNVSSEAKSDFASAVAHFQAQDKAGWTNDKCGAAADRFLAVASSHDKLIEAYYNAGVSYQKCGDAKNAEGMYKKAVGINPSHAPSLANLGEIYFRAGNDDTAKQYFEQAIKADPKITAARNNLAWIFYTSLRGGGDKRWEDEALGQLARVLAVDNDNIVAYTIMALVYMEGSEKNRSRLDLARLLLDEGKKRNDKYAPLYNAWGLLYMKRANVGQALEQFRRAVELDNDFLEARMNVAQIVLSFRKYQEAKDNFEFVLGKSAPKEMKYDATVGLGVALRGLKQIPDAQAKYEEAMKILPERGDAYYNMGLLYKDFMTNDPDPKENKKAYAKAKTYFQQYLGKGQGSAEKKEEAKDNIDDCEKTIAALDLAIEQMSQQPPPAPAPAPAPK